MTNSLGATSLWPAGLPKAIKYFFHLGGPQKNAGNFHQFPGFHFGYRLYSHLWLYNLKCCSSVFPLKLASEISEKVYSEATTLLKA
jgi:hypothetical protein